MYTQKNLRERGQKTNLTLHCLNLFQLGQFLACTQSLLLGFLPAVSFQMGLTQRLSPSVQAQILWWAPSSNTSRLVLCQYETKTINQFKLFKSNAWASLNHLEVGLVIFLNQNTWSLVLLHYNDKKILDN